MIILGIDPGTATTGFGIIKKEKNNYTVLDFGCILTPANLALPERLNQIADDLTTLIKKYHPTESAIESLYFSKNVKTALLVAEARGVILHTLYNQGLEIAEYTPLQVKIALTGYGQADKKQIQQMVKSILKLKCCPTQDDAADALAIAICHGNTIKLNIAN